MIADNRKGFTLIELMITVAIIAILAAVSLPLYRNYIQTSQTGVLVNNIASIEVFQEDFRLRTGAFLTTAASAAAINTAIGWQPQSNDGTTYSIAAGPGTSYEVTATSPTGIVVCRRFPDKVEC